MKHLKSIFAALVLAAVFVAAKPAGYGVGDTVADFKLKNVDGKMVSLADFKSAKGAIVIFDCNTCPVSKAYNSRIIALNEKYKPLGYPVIAIQPNAAEIVSGDSFEEMVKVAKRKNYKFPYVIDETQEVAKQFGATNTPHTFILKREEGSFKVAYIGAIDNNQRNPEEADKKYVENALDELLAGKKVTSSKTKAIGCSIKWKPA
jgi:peroxiredoxin